MLPENTLVGFGWCLLAFGWCLVGFWLAFWLAFAVFAIGVYCVLVGFGWLGWLLLGVWLAFINVNRFNRGLKVEDFVTLCYPLLPLLPFLSTFAELLLHKKVPHHVPERSNNLLTQ